jgi:predicted metal-dependent enzyme (double-stranded beta helix superfamily)
MDKIKEVLKEGATVETLNHAKGILGELAARRELFPETDFPWPSAEENNHMYCVYRCADGNLALYIDVLLHGVSNAPHNHGDSWAIVSGIHGQEKHLLYKRIDGGNGPGPAELEVAGEITLAQGDGVSMLDGGIHSVGTVGSESVMMLHCYGKAFEDQAARLEFDLTKGTCAYGTDATGVIFEHPLHAAALS